MSIEEAKLLLRKFRIVPNKVLGQNFMVDPRLFPLLSDYASLSCDDVVVDAGAGFGFLTRYLSAKCKSVVAIEKDPRVALVLRKQLSDADNVTVIEGNILKVALPSSIKSWQFRLIICRRVWCCGFLSSELRAQCWSCSVSLLSGWLPVWGVRIMAG